MNPSAMASRAVRAPTVAPTSPVMLFGFGKKEEAPKKGGRKVVKKVVKKTVRHRACTEVESARSSPTAHVQPAARRR